MCVYVCIYIYIYICIYTYIHGPNLTPRFYLVVGVAHWSLALRRHRLVHIHIHIYIRICVYVYIYNILYRFVSFLVVGVAHRRLALRRHRGGRRARVRIPARRRAGGQERQPMEEVNATQSRPVSGWTVYISSWSANPWKK